MRVRILPGVLMTTQASVGGWWDTIPGYPYPNTNPCIQTWITDGTATVSGYVDPVKKQALEYALLHKHYSDTIEKVIAAAKEYEKFLRGY